MAKWGGARVPIREPILGALLKCILIVTLIAGYPDIMRGGQSAFIEVRNRFTNARDAKFVQLLRSTVENQPSDSLTDIGKIVPAAIGYFFQGIGRFMLLVLRFFQEFAIAGLIAISPLLIGFLFFSYTQSVGVHFGVTSLTVLLWHVAICLVDITIQLISDVLFLPITTGGLVQTAQNMIIVQNWLLFPFIMAFAAFLTVFFYLSVPFVAGAVMKGLSGTTASLQAGVQGTMQAAGLAVGAGLTAAGARGHLWRVSCRPGCYRTERDSVQMPRVQSGELPTTTLASMADLPRTVGGVPDIPAPPPLTPAPVGERISSESNASLTAHQTAAEFVRSGRSRQAERSRITGETFSRRKRLRPPSIPTRRMPSRFRPFRRRYLHPLTPKAINPPKAMKFSAIDAITNNLVAARFWMFLAILFAGLAVASPYFTVLAMRAKEKVVILDPGGTLIYAPLLGFEEAGQLHAYHVRLACLAFSTAQSCRPRSFRSAQTPLSRSREEKGRCPVSSAERRVQRKANSPEG